MIRRVSRRAVSPLNAPRTGRLAAGGLALLLALAGCSSPEDGVLHYGLTLAPSGIDPHINASVELGIPLSSVYDTLVFRDPETGEFVPGLALRWEIAADGTTYTFTLRDDVRFHDGTRFDAEAVKINLERVLDPENRSQKAAGMLGPLERVEVVDEHTVRLHLSQPYAPLLDSLSQVYLGMASPSALERWGPGEYQFNQVGSGPYRFVEFVPNDHLILERNPDYAWGPSIYAAETAAVERIEFRFYEDPATRAPALEGGQVHVIGELPHDDAARLSTDYVISTVRIPGQPTQFLFNLEAAPTDDPAVREALTLAVNRQRAVGTVYGDSSPVAEGPLAMVTEGASSVLDPRSHDPDRAGALLDSAGWLLSGGRRTKDGEELRIKLVVPSWGSNPAIGQLVAADWMALGAQVNLEVAPGFGPLNQAQAEGEYHAIGMNSFGSDPDLLRPFYESGGFFNWSGVHDPELDRLLNEAAQGTADRTGLYAQSADLIQSEWLVLPLRDYVVLVGADPAVDGLRFSYQGWFPFLIDLKLQR